ncbi:HNH endonuclease [Candidatus Gracilibacteria bacterium]|nr:HNH endonuclease [Candidatus Gracilibacteria bacterium]
MPSGVYQRTDKHRSINIGRKHPKRKRPFKKGLTPIPKVCLFCEKDFVTNCFMPKKKFCSKSCSSKSHPEINLANLEKRDKEKQKAVMRRRTGEKHHAWIKDRTIALENHRIRGLIKVKEWRTAIFHRDDFTCQECGIRGGYLEAHHIKPWRNFKALRHDINNGITLCRPCHIKTMQKEELFEERYTQIILTKL